MSQISAAENLVIDMQADRWRLLVNGDFEARVLLDATSGEPLRYVPGFGTTRRLPSSGALTLDQVQRIVLGWSNKDEAWHLGLILEGELATTRGSRWCEIAYWPDPDTDVFIDLATEAGKSLAATLSRPFNLIQPRKEPVAPPPPPPPLPSLPLTMGLWTLNWAGKRKRAESLAAETLAQSTSAPEQSPLEFSRASGWVFAKVVRISWYSLWVVVYLILSIATLTRKLALPNSGTMLPNPQLLPILGLVAAFVLVVMILYHVYEIFAKPDRIVVDAQTRTVTALRGQNELWQISGDRALAIYVTQVVSKKSNKPIVQHGEINLHLGTDSFYCVLEQSIAQESDQPWRANVTLDEEVVIPLTSEVINTDLQAAGLYIAKALGDLPCRYDQRRK